MDEISEYGDPLTLPVGDDMPWGIYRHTSPKAGKHRDFRFGHEKLYSFATKKDIPIPGADDMIRLYQTPLHPPEFLQLPGGNLPPKYGKGVVWPEKKGRLKIDKVNENHIKFTVNYGEGVSEQFILIKDTKAPKGWLLKNITPLEEKTASFSYQLGRYLFRSML